MADRKIIYEAECPACCEMVEFYNIGWKICPHCKSVKAEFGIAWEVIEEKDDD